MFKNSSLSGLLGSVDLQTVTDVSEHCRDIIFGSQWAHEKKLRTVSQPVIWSRNTHLS